MKITRFEDIEAWQMARSLTRLVYNAVKNGSFVKDYGLRDQVCRACVSIMANDEALEIIGSFPEEQRESIAGSA